MRTDVCFNGHVFPVFASRRTSERLQATCFRKPGLQAGNFLYWESLAEVFSDHTLRSELSEEFAEKLKAAQEDGRPANWSVTINHPNVIGWASTAPVNETVGWELVQKHVNGHCTALFAGESEEAPLTNLVTVVYRVFNSDKFRNWAVEVLSVYPGEDVGELDGDISKREGRVFFPWTSPGSSAWVCND